MYISEAFRILATKDLHIPLFCRLLPGQTVVFMRKSRVAILGELQQGISTLIATRMHVVHSVLPCRVSTGNRIDKIGGRGSAARRSVSVT